jgi:hypothetical protein
MNAVLQRQLPAQWLCFFCALMWRAVCLHRAPFPRTLLKRLPPVFRSHLYNSPRSLARIPPQRSAVGDSDEDDSLEKLEDLVDGVISDMSDIYEDEDESEEVEEGEEAEEKEEATLDEMLLDDDDDIPPFEDDDATSVGHFLLRDRRRVLKYLRLIELEVPLLAGTAFPFLCCYSIRINA